MARTFTTPEKALLRAPAIKGRLLTDWYLDSGTFHFCDDVEDLTDGVTTWVGASILGVVSDIKSAAQFAAESVTLQVDGTRLNISGFTDPADLFRGILALPLHQRRVDFSWGLMYPDVQDITLKIPIYAGKINNVKMTYPQVTFDTSGIAQPSPGVLTVTLDSLAARYSRVTGRTRSHSDQLEIDPTDTFFEFVVASDNDKTLFWGKSNPNNSNPNGTLQYSNNYNGGF